MDLDLGCGLRCCKRTQRCNNGCKLKAFDFDVLLEQIKHTHTHTHTHKCLNIEILHNDKRRLYYRPHNCGTDIILLFFFLFNI